MTGLIGLTLPVMIEAPGWRSESYSSPRPVLGAGAHPADIGVDPGQRHFDRAHRAGCLDQTVAVRLRLKMIPRVGNRRPSVGDDELNPPLREAQRGVDAGANSDAAQRDLRNPRWGRLNAFDAEVHSRLPIERIITPSGRKRPPCH